MILVRRSECITVYQCAETLEGRNFEPNASLSQRDVFLKTLQERALVFSVSTH